MTVFRFTRSNFKLHDPHVSVPKHGKSGAPGSNLEAPIFFIGALFESAANDLMEMRLLTYRGGRLKWEMKKLSKHV